MAKDARPIAWVKAARKAFHKFPEEVQEYYKSALTIVAEGKMPDTGKPLVGFEPGVIELVKQYNKDAYRCVYYLKLDDRIWVLHAFKKKSKSGVRTPRQDVFLIRHRIKMLKAMLNERKN